VSRCSLLKCQPFDFEHRSLPLYGSTMNPLLINCTIEIERRTYCNDRNPLLTFRWTRIVVDVVESRRAWHNSIESDHYYRTIDNCHASHSMCGNLSRRVNMSTRYRTSVNCISVTRRQSTNRSDWLTARTSSVHVIRLIAVVLHREDLSSQCH
jgi:hypothetical protein